MLTVVLLARSYRDGASFAAKSGLGRKAIIPAASGSLGGIRPDVILELEGYSTRPDIHAFEAKLKASAFSKPAIRMLVSLDDLPVEIVEPTPEPAGPDELPGQTTVEHQVALAEADRMRRLSAFEQTAPTTSETQHEANAPVVQAETPPKPAGYQPRSRKRAKP